MRTIVNPEDGELTVPEHPEPGEQFEHAMIYGNGSIAFADTLGELIDLIIPDYSALSDDPSGDDLALLARHDHMAGVANAVQADFNTQAVERGLFDVASADENLLTATTHDRHEPWSGSLPTGPDGAPLADAGDYGWTQPFPLVLIATDYSPYCERPTPSGEVILLDPYDEQTYLASLTSLGFVQYMSRDTFGATAQPQAV